MISVHSFLINNYILGNENNFKECPISNFTDEYLKCDWKDESFVFVYCTESILPEHQHHWGGIR